MLEFPVEFFQEEVRSGFTVDSMMKRVWAAQLEVLQRVAEICKEEKIRQYAFWGTLLGAVRHKGFIPWDDDIDIAMPREDYLKFLGAAKTRLPEGYRLLDVYHEPEWQQSFARVVNGDTIDISEKRLKAFHGCPFVVGIDIFPLDEWAEEEAKRNYQQEVLKIVRTLAVALLKEEKAEESIKQQLHDIVMEGVEALEEGFGIEIDKSENILNQLCRFYDRVCMEGNFQTSGAYAAYAIDNDKYDCRYDKEWFRSTETFSFENSSVLVPCGYKEILTELFGDYMTPVRTFEGHSYPFYGEQLEQLRQKWPDFGS
ncbi:MAG: LicD family protein [Lachnospiraceae bacterium]|nr:LicD family protein [Lachnospiraceae bacterium]